MEERGINASGSVYGEWAGCCEHDNEYSDALKLGYLIEW